MGGWLTLPLAPLPPFFEFFLRARQATRRFERDLVKHGRLPKPSQKDIPKIFSITAAGAHRETRQSGE